ncbi:MAG: tetratricopeptide repeat protein [Pseudomonadota bacterium]
MRVRCENCQAQYNVDDGRVPPQGVSITCPKCQTTFVVKPGSGIDQAVPLPSSGATPPGFGAVPLPGSTPVFPTGQSAIPLPGRAAPTPAARPAVPFPGAPSTPQFGQGAVPLPGGTPARGGAVPLPAGTGGGSAPAPRASGLSDIFGDTGERAPGTIDSIPSHPFHGDSSVAKAQRRGSLADFIDQQAPSAPTASTLQYQVRRRSGRVFGPYDESTILSMLRKFEFAGNEEASADGHNWKPLSAISVFAEEIQALTAAALGGLGALPSRNDPDLPGLAGVDLPGLPNMDLPGLPNMDLPGLPRADLPGLPNADLPGLSGRDLPGLSNRELPGLRNTAPVVYNPDQHGRGAPSMGPDPMADIGISFSDGQSLSSGSIDHASLAPNDPLAIDLSLSVEDRVRTKGRGPRVKGAREPRDLRSILLFIASTLMIVIIAGGVFLGLATDHGWFGYNWVGKHLIPKDDPNPTDTPVPVPNAVSTANIDEYIARDNHVASAQAVLVLSAQATMTPELAVKSAYVYARMALLDDDRSGVVAGRGALARAGDLAQSPDALFAGAVFDLLEGNCDGAIELLKTEVGADPPKEPKPQLGNLLPLMGLAHSCNKFADPEKANLFVDAALMADPHNQFALWVQARLALRMEDPATAEGYLQKLVEEKPDDARAWLHLAEASLLVKGHEDQARRSFETALTVGASTLAPWQIGRASLGLATLHRDMRQFKEAEDVAGKSFASAGGHPPTLKLIGNFALDLFMYDLAQKVFRRCVEIEPNDREAVVGLARALAGSRNPLEAYEALNRLLKSDPKDAYLTFWMGQIHLAMTKRAQARDLFSKAHTLDPKSAAPLVALVQYELALGDIDGAQRWITKYRDGVAPDQQGEMDLAQSWVHQRLRNFPAAMSSVQKAIDSKWNGTRVQIQKALILIDELHPKEAAPLIRDAYADNPNDPFRINAMALLVIAQGKPKEAVRLLEDALARDKTIATYNLTTALAHIDMGEWDTAIEDVRIASEVEPDHINVLYYRGLALRGKGDYKNALAVFKQGEQVSPKDARFSLEMGRTYAANGDFLDAIDYFKSTIFKDEHWALAYFELGKAYMELVRYNTAREQFDQALRLRPDWAVVHMWIGDTVAKSGDYPTALKEYRAAIAGDPQLTEAHCKSGSVLKNNGKLKDAEKDLIKCLKGNPKHPEAHKWLGYIFKDLKRKRDAIESFERHLKFSPDDLENELVRDEIQTLKNR